MEAPAKAMDKYYPNRADPPLARILPLNKYLGTYHHPAYQNITLTLTEESGDGTHPKRELRSAQTDFVWKVIYEFEHVSGEYWLVFINMQNTPNGFFQQYGKAEFKLGVSGDVEGLEIEYFEDGTEGTIYYKKIE
jgi:hypothetical protein